MKPFTGVNTMMLKLLAIAILASTQVYAQTATTTTTESSTSVMTTDQAVKGNDRKDTDEEITNAKMRASTGSKSKYSIQSAIGYSAGSIEKPFAKERPRLSAGAATELSTVVSGDISMKYRMNDHNNLNVGTGIGLTTPGFTGQRSQVSTPYVSVSNVGKMGQIQSVLSATGSYFSTKAQRDDAKLDFNIALEHTMILSVGKSGLDLGFDYSADNNFYQDSNTVGDIKDGPSEREDLTLAGYPFMEYAFTDKVSFRTVYRGLMFLHLRGENFGQYRQADPTQSMGIGFAVTRDIYLYPNVQWVWGDIRSDKTNIALSTNINLF